MGKQEQFVTSIFPLLSKYSITIERRSLILYGLLSLFVSGAGCAAGITMIVSYELRHIIEQAAMNRVVLDSLKVESAEIERQANLMEQRCLGGEL